ncbi:MAG: phosphohydrolase [Phenylobacterium sp.]|uniref:HD domain-containing protein n=1 Tax=Phenylobacterium sp. TaxID=1871053 RepID=UPI002716B481|nr:phosphohydrolase [Phenylobacterium sp.]MDO8410801.1 phosphohydrolase [Phenylobacterium sp.]
MDRAQSCAFWLDPGPPAPGHGLAGETKARLRAAYGEPHRRYHDMTHIADCLAELAAVEGLADERRLRLAYAIWWHDVVYDPTRSDNEAASAAQAQRDLTALGESEATCAEVARLIELTTGHQVGENDADGALLVSIDLAVLGRSPAGYDAYAAAIRQEYAHVPDAFFRPGRASVLKRILEAQPIYPEPAYRARYEDQARANLAREIAALS